MTSNEYHLNETELAQLIDNRILRHLHERGIMPLSIDFYKEIDRLVKERVKSIEPSL